MHIIYCLQVPRNGAQIATGCIVRGLELMRGMQQNGAKVSVILSKENTSQQQIELPDDLDIYFGNPHHVIRQQKLKPDILYIRGHPLVPALAQNLPKVPRCLELYLHPWNNTPTGQKLQHESIRVYKSIDKFVVVGKYYHNHSTYLLKNKYRYNTLIPNRTIYPAYPEIANTSAPNKFDRPYLVGIMDAISKPHLTHLAVKGINVFDCHNPSKNNKFFIGGKVIKDIQYWQQVRNIAQVNNNIKIVYPTFNTRHQYFQKCNILIALYSQSNSLCTLGGDPAVPNYNYLVSLRVIEALGFGCIPIVTDAPANEEIFGKLLPYFSVPDTFLENSLACAVSDKIEQIVQNPQLYLSLLEKLNIKQYYAKNVSGQLLTFLGGNL